MKQSYVIASRPPSLSPVTHHTPPPLAPVLGLPLGHCALGLVLFFPHGRPEGQRGKQLLQLKDQQNER